MQKDKSLSKGGIYYLIYNVMNMIFPFFTGIYVSHILLPASIGRVSAAQNFAQYFAILAFLGIPTYGLREIAKTRNNMEERSRIYSELYVINLTSTLFFSSIYITSVFLVNAYRSELSLFLIAGITIALNTFNISWLYEGLEEYKFVSIRNLIFKVLSFLVLIILVKTEEDVLWYALVTVLGTAGNYIVNMLYAPRFVKFTLRGLNFSRHFKPILFLVAVNLAIELYSLVDITMMNFICDKDSIAFYKYGLGIKRILLQVVNTFTMVLVPRISFYYKEGQLGKFNSLLSKALKMIVMVSLPMIVGIYFTADSLMVKIYGDAYIASAGVLKILSLLLLISPIGYLLGSRVLLATGNEKKMIIPVGIGAIINIIGNAIMIPLYSEYGAAIASVISEIIVMVVYVFLGHKHFQIRNISSSLVKTIIGCVSLCVYLWLVSICDFNSVIILVIQIVGSMLLYPIALLFFKEDIALEYWGIIKRKIKH